jgi:hypothetical protein
MLERKAINRRTETAYKAITRASQHNMTKSPGFRRGGKCCGCAVTVQLHIRRDLSRMPVRLYGHWLEEAASNPLIKKGEYHEQGDYHE